MPGYAVYVVITGVFVSAIIALYIVVVNVRRLTLSKKVLGRFGEIAGNGDGTEFELFLSGFFEASGWRVKNPTASTNMPDYGVDMILNGKIAVQAKNYSYSVGNDAVQAVFTGMEYWRKNGFPRLKRAVVITSSSFTRSAKDTARATGVRLKDGDDIRNIFNDGFDKKWFLKNVKEGFRK